MWCDIGILEQLMMLITMYMYRLALIKLFLEMDDSLIHLVAIHLVVIRLLYKSKAFKTWSIIINIIHGKWFRSKIFLYPYKPYTCFQKKTDHFLKPASVHSHNVLQYVCRKLTMNIVKQRKEWKGISENLSNSEVHIIPACCKC